MAKHFKGCTCASCEDKLEQEALKLDKGVKRSIAYARYVKACQEAQKHYKDEVAKAREIYETQVSEL